MTTKVDDSLFEQAPAEEAPPATAAALSALSSTLSVRAPELAQPVSNQAVLVEQAPGCQRRLSFECAGLLACKARPSWQN